ncbi:MAG: hypothetical protein H0T89_25525 [Deltaproteobacteria bacterium]|nr:hypothetical protein [Deltaproteobacteria bacterium]
MSTADAITHCKRTDGAMVVIEDDVPCVDWEPTCSALRREGVRIAMRGPLGDFRGTTGMLAVASNLPHKKPPAEKPVLRCQATCP